MISVASRVTPLIDGGAIFPVAHRLLSEAKESIQLEMYELGNEDVDGSKGPDVPGYKEQQMLIPDLVAAAQRGVKVQVLLDQSKAKDNINNEKMLAYLKDNGIDARPYPHTVVHLDHVKSLVVDSQSALIGGMNWGTHSPANHDADVLIEGDDARMVQSEVFEKDWAFSGGTVDSPAQVPPSDGHVQVVTTRPKSEGGEKDIKAAVLNEIQNTKNHAYVEMFTLTSADTINELIDAKKRGVDVKVILDPTEHAVNLKAFNTLEKADVPVKWFAVDTKVKQKLHAKWGEFDGHSLIVGSCNWSANGFGSIVEPMGPRSGGTHNHEADVLVHDDNVAQTFQNQFITDWNDHTKKTLDENFLSDIHQASAFTLVESGE